LHSCLERGLHTSFPASSCLFVRRRRTKPRVRHTCAHMYMKTSWFRVLSSRLEFRSFLGPNSRPLVSVHPDSNSG
jgi:hypothetical protein